MLYYEILPLKKTGIESQTFTYASEANLTIGSLVQMPLKRREVSGIVIEEVSKPSYSTRPITKVLSTDEIVTKSQIEIAKKISEYYFCSLGEVIKTYLPFDFGKKRRANIANQILNNPAKQTTIRPNKEQQNIIKIIKNSQPGSTHLVHGITGSGKTEVYLRLVEDALTRSNGSIVLVPEIALTPQTFERFHQRFGKKVALWHSELKETEKFSTWNRIKSGEAMIVLGARSAIFTPVVNLEYIIIDEEHESSYKQDQNPRYDARLVAEWTIKQSGAKLVLGSATPRIESYSKSKNNEYNYYSMNKRIVQESLPPVSIVDLRDEFRKGNRSIISDNLMESIKETLGTKKQVMLLVNRRGAATFVFCRDCGYTESCPKCDIPLTYHPSEGHTLKCHHCDYRKPVPTTCPKCNSMAIKFYGLGTQRAEMELKKIFPEAKIARMDRDTTQKRGMHEEIFRDFKTEKYDILIGTQMIAKGWDLPNVELVGVITADTMLNIPDFRSAERTFDLLTQVAGRTGRGYHPGKVIVQTYNPDNYAVKTAAKHDYEAFYNLEINSREKYSYPPYSSLIKLTYSHPDRAKAAEEAKRLTGALETLQNGDNFSILGPSPAFLERLAGKYRYQLVIKLPVDKFQISNSKSQTNVQFPNVKSQIINILKKNIKPGWQVDIDPETLL